MAAFPAITALTHDEHQEHHNVNPKHAAPKFLIVATLCAASLAQAATPAKYVFFFLGDGMANPQVQSTEAYLTTINGGSATLAKDLRKPENRLNMSKMKVQGMQTTYDAGALMTDSASSATAFASGLKTKSGVIGMNETMTKSYKSVAELAHQKGRKVGVLTSVSLDHATPAAYYASVESRGYMNNIATQLTQSGYEFFGGGGFASPEGPARAGDTSNNIWDLLDKQGYKILNTRQSILALKKNPPKGKIVAINPTLDDSAAMPYAIDRPATNVSLTEMTEVAISSLFAQGKQSGFFLMVEGGKIDWACHANDAVAAIGDMLDFDSAIGKALDFYKQHPDETLIIVTGDHETGGMTVGHATTGYTAYYDKLLDQTNSYEHFAANQWEDHKATYAKGYQWKNPKNLANNAAMVALLNDTFGLEWASLNDYQKEKLEDAYDKSMTKTDTAPGQNNNSDAENTLLYGSYEPIVVTITHILNEIASIGWTSYSHTGVPTPVYAQGPQAPRFQGFYDNTDIAKRLAKAMDLGVNLPSPK
ncbi:alkaline phosphatase [Thiobaca trueperi]|uniref:Alkaline phosphatase n=1 Tax=Thiobaca trueperi TaxID=127458 RepID=A0A4R3MSC9_9GAMM|nr:alkaline phosphatase [Thiobaca trueperi]